LDGYAVEAFLELELIYYVALVRLPSLLGAVLLEGPSILDPYKVCIVFSPLSNRQNGLAENDVRSKSQSVTRIAS
jgi:hypothetical protein